MKWYNFAFIIFITIFVAVFSILQMKAALTEDEQESCKSLCERRNMVYKGGNDFTNNGLGCKVCYCELTIPFNCGD